MKTERAEKTEWRHAAGSADGHLDDPLRGGDAGVHPLPELHHARGERHGRDGAVHAGQLPATAQPQLSQSAGKQPETGGDHHADLPAGGLSLRLSDGQGAAQAPRHTDAAGDRALLDERPCARLRLAHPPDGRWADQRVFADAGADRQAAQTAQHLRRGGAGHGVRAFALHDPAYLFLRGKDGLGAGGGQPRHGRFAPARLFHRDAAPDRAGRAGGLRFDVRPLHRPVFHERPSGRGQRRVPRQPHQRPAP